MALTNAQLKSDQALAFSDFPTEEITISGVTYNCLVMDQSKGNEFGEGGLVDSVTLRVAINRNDMTTIPTRGTLATYSSQSLRIGQVEQDDANSSIILTLENLTIR